MTTAPRRTRTTIARLVSAAGGDRDDLDDLICDVGVEVAAGIVAAEMRDRAELSPGSAVEVLLRLRHGHAVVEHLLGGPQDGRLAGAPDAVVEQELGEVVGALFGPRGPRRAATRRIRWRDLDDPSAFGWALPVVDVVRRLLDVVDRPFAPGLAELCVRYGSDKWGIHQYPQHYERYFGPVRVRALTILAGDQSDPADLARLLAVTGTPDIVIDDGSHVSAHLLASFEILFPALRPGGLYILEDLQTSYWPSFGGQPGESDDPATSMGFLKRLVDGLHHEEIDDRLPRTTDATVGGVHVHHNLAVVEKALNLDGGAPGWIPRR